MEYKTLNSSDENRSILHNNLVGKLFAFLFNSDRTACIHYIKQHGKDSIAKTLADSRQMTMKKRK